jgi:hypothetical protein
VKAVSAFWPAVICGTLGRMDDGIRHLEAAHRERAPWLAYAKVAPFLDGLRGAARFEALLRRMNFPA